MDKWTAQDEKRLNELIQEKKEFYGKNSKPILDLVRTHYLVGFDMDAIVKKLCDHASEFRAALAPFDIGLPIIKDAPLQYDTTLEEEMIKYKQEGLLLSASCEARFAKCGCQVCLKAYVNKSDTMSEKLTLVTLPKNTTIPHSGE